MSRRALTYKTVASLAKTHARKPCTLLLLGPCGQVLAELDATVGTSFSRWHGALKRRTIVLTLKSFPVPAHEDKCVLLLIGKKRRYVLETHVHITAYPSITVPFRVDAAYSYALTSLAESDKGKGAK